MRRSAGVKVINKASKSDYFVLQFHYVHSSLKYHSVIIPPLVKKKEAAISGQTMEGDVTSPKDQPTVDAHISRRRLCLPVAVYVFISRA